MGKLRNVAAIAAALVVVPAAARADGIERRLYPDRVEASSFLWNDWNRFQENYHPNYIADDDPKTAWTEGADSAGAGEWLRVHITELDGATRVRLRVRNGYHKSKRLFTRNARAKQVTLRLLPSGTEKVVTLSDNMKWQDVTVSQPAGKLTGFEMKFDSVYDGTHYTDLCVSDVQVFATATTPDNPSFERGKKKRLLDWKRQRVKAARMFKKSAGKALPIAPQYRAETVGAAVKSPKCSGDDSFCEARAAIAAARAQWKDEAGNLDRAQHILDKQLPSWRAARVSAIDKRAMPEVDGTRSPHPFNRHWIDESSFDLPVVPKLGFMRAKLLKRVYDAKSTVGIDDALAATAKGCRKLDEPSYYMWTPEASGAGGQAHLQSLFVVSCSTYEERDGEYAVANWQLLVYDASGNLSLMVGPQYVTRFSWRDGKAGPVLDRAERVAVGVKQTAFAAATPAPTK